MKNYSIARSRRLRSTPYTSRIEKQGVTAYTSYNHMLLPAAFGSLEDSHHRLFVANFRIKIARWNITLIHLL